MRASTGRQSGRQSQREKQAPCGARSPMWDLIPGPIMTRAKGKCLRLSHPGTLLMDLKKKKIFFVVVFQCPGLQCMIAKWGKREKWNGSGVVDSCHFKSPEATLAGWEGTWNNRNASTTMAAQLCLQHCAPEQELAINTDSWYLEDRVLFVYPTLAGSVQDALGPVHSCLPCG